MEITRPAIGTTVTATFPGSDGYDTETVEGHVIDLDSDSILIGIEGGELATIFDDDQRTGLATVVAR